MSLTAIDAKTAKSWVKAASKVHKADAEPPAKTAAAGAGDGAKPRLQIGGLKHSPATFAKGKEVKSTVTVTNNGATDIKLKLKLLVNEDLADSTIVAVKAGKSKEASFNWTAQEKNKLNIRGEMAK